ncbi:MAG: hypothetical protein WCC92_04285 [Candidatus Korobacteraceae bacterium]
MKTAVLLLSMLTLAATMAVAQMAPHSNYASTSGDHSSATTSQSNDLRGCLSGTKGNYTLLDHQGKTHKVTGDNHELWDEVGHEVDLTGKPNSGNTFQETEITDIDSRCWNFKLN